MTQGIFDDIIPIWWYRKALSRAHERQSSIRMYDEAVYVANAGEFRAYASHGFYHIMESRTGSKREKEKINAMISASWATYLYKGTGNPWAGHSNVTEPSFVVRKLLESSIVGNLGLTLPIGSDHIVYNWDLRVRGERSSRRIRVLYGLYLNRGTGNPCAGHIRAWEPAMNVRKPRMSSVDGIFGRTLPTGSKKHVFVFASPVYKFDII